MAQTYTRQSSFADGDTITAALFNDEYNQLVNAFAYSSSSSSSTGHRHDGTAAQGGNIFKIGDLDFLNKIEVDSSNNRWGFYVEVSAAAVEQIRIQDGALVPVTDSDIDLGTTSLRFKDTFTDSITTTGNVDVGGNLTVTGTTTFNGGTITMGDAADDNVVFGADVNSNIIPNTDNTYDLGSSSQEWKDLYVDGVAYLDGINFDGTAITATAAELNILDGVTSTAAELNILDGVTSTTAELNILDGVTSTAAELNILDGVTATAAELNILDGVTSTAAELNLLDGVTATTTELNYVDVATAGTVEASKAIVVDSNKDFTGTRNITTTGSLSAGGGSTNGIVISQGAISIKNGGVQSYIDFYCESSNAHYARLQAPAHGSFSGNPTIILPSTAGTLALTSSNITGNAATATALQTARTIHGVSFDGTANIDLSEVIQDTVGAMVSSNTESGITVAYEDSDGTLDFTVGTLNQDTTGNAATATALETARTIHGVSFDGTANIDLTEVVQDTVGAMFSSNTETGITATYEDSDGTIDLAVGNVATVSDGSNSTAIASGGTITFAGTSNEIDVAESSGTITYGLPNNVTIGNNLTVSGNLIVSGTTTNTGPIVSDDNFTGLTNANSGNATDFGFFGKYVESSTTKYAGLYYDASTDNTFRLFSDTQTEPAATVDTSATGYAAANLIVNNLTGTLATAAQSNITSLGTLTSLTVSGDVTVDTNTLKVDSSNNRVGIGNASPDVSLDIGSFTDAIHVPVGTTAQRPTGAAGYIRYNSTTGAFEGYSNQWGALATSSTVAADDITTGDAAITLGTSSGTITLDSPDDIHLDADGDHITFKDNGTEIGHIDMGSQNLTIRSKVSDKDIIFRGNDGGTDFAALTLDMSEAGAATFNGSIDVGGSITKTGDLSLDVSGNITLDADGGVISLQDGGVETGQLKPDSAGLVLQAVGSDLDIFFSGSDGGSAITAVRIDMSDAGALICNGNITAFGSTSDIRLKENIEVIPDALDKVKQLKGVTFNYKKDGKISTGLIAQDLEKVLPEAVYESSDVDNDEDKHLAIRYGNTVGLLVEAIKELEARVKELEGK